MKVQKLTETVLLQLEALWVLQELDEATRRNDAKACEWIRGLYQRRAVAWDEIHPLLRLPTTLSLLVIPISFANQVPEVALHNFGVDQRHEIVYREGGVEKHPTAKDVLRVLRNALAHLPDFIAGDVCANISFDEGILHCRSKTKSSELVFKTEAGFVEFLRDLLPAIRSAAGSFARAHSGGGAA